MESSMSSDTEDEVFFGPILAKENRISSKLRRRTEVFDPTFRKKKVASCSDSSDSHTETSLSDVFVEEPFTSTTKSPKPPLLPISPGFLGESPAIDSPLPRDVERTKSKDTADDQKESPFQMKGKALLDLIHKTKEEWSSPTQSPRNMTESGTKSPMKRRFFSSSTSDSGGSSSEKVSKRTCTLPLQNDALKAGEPSVDESVDLTETIPSTITDMGDDEGGDDEMFNEDDLNYGVDQSNLSEDKMHLLRRKNVGLPICQNLSSVFEENSKAVAQVEESCQVIDRSMEQFRQEENEIERGEALWVKENLREKQTSDSDNSIQSKDSEVTRSDASSASNEEYGERSSVLNSEAIFSIQGSQHDSLDSSVWSEHLSEQDQIGNNKLERQREEIVSETSLNIASSVSHDESSEKNEISLQARANENSLVTAPLSAFAKVSSQSRSCQISSASLKELSFRKFTPSMSSSPRDTAFESPIASSRKGLNIPEVVHSELGSVLQDSTNLVQQVNSPKYFPAITMVDIQKNDSVQECVGSPGLTSMGTPLKTEEAYTYSSPLPNQETRATKSCQISGATTINSVLSPQHRNVVKLQSDSPLQLRRLLEQKRTQLMRLKQAKEEVMQKLTEENEHFSLQVENALALRRNMASLEDIQRSPLLRENISRLESSPPGCLDENSFDELTRFYTWKNSQQKMGDESPYISPMAAINRKRNRPHLRWVENLVVDVTQLSSPSRPVNKRKSILLKRM